MSNENNKMQVDIENLFKQNVNDLLSIKELYKRIEELGEKITQIKYIDSTLVKKLQKEYEKLNKIILDENIQVKLTNDIESINSQLDNIVTILTPTGGDDTDLINNTILNISSKNVVKKIQLNGNFKVSSKVNFSYSINMKSNIILEFLQGSTITMIPTSNNGYKILNCENIENFSIINPTIIGDLDLHTGEPNSGGQTFGHGIYINGCKNFELKRVNVYNTWGDGISFVKTNDSYFDNENGCVDSIYVENINRNGVHVEHGKNLSIGSIVGKDITNISPKACVDFECDFKNRRWENITVNSITSYNTGGIKIQPGYMRDSNIGYEYNLKIGNISIYDSGNFVFRGINNDLIKGNVIIENLNTYRLKQMCIYLENSALSKQKLTINNLNINDNTKDANITKDNDFAIYLSKGTEWTTGGIGQVTLRNVRITGDNVYSIKHIPDITAKHNFIVENLITDKPINSNLIKGANYNNCKITCNTDDIMNIYNPPNAWITYHCCANVYHNQNSVTNMYIGFSSGSVSFRNIPITLENKSQGYLIGADFGAGKVIYPTSLGFTRGFKSSSLGSRIEFIQDENDNIIIKNMIGTWVSL